MSMIWRPGFMFDVDASNYIEAVEAADGQQLETAVRYAYNDLFIGCKEDGTFSALKASCIMAGARTLAGALTPLLSSMPAPTNVGLVAGDYNRKTGLAGNGSTKYLNSNRANSADPQNNNHASVYVTTATTSSSGVNAYPAYLGTAFSTTPFAGTQLSRDANNGLLYTRNNSGTFSFMGAGSQTGLIATARSTSTTATYRTSGTTNSYSSTSVAPLAASAFIHAASRETGLPGIDSYSNGRISFYSIGESLNLALLDARVTTLMQALSIAIP